MKKIFSVLIFLLLATFFSPVFSNSPPPDEDFAPWLNECKSKILKAGGEEVAKQFSNDKRLGCSFAVLSDGQPADIKIQLSSKDDKADASVIALVRKAAPFPQCPIPPADRSICLSFNETFTVVHYQGRLR
ncbi:MAG: energy transducer TonB [Candidatus Melainabacteria bacterium]|nr:energy transducer TonB [Candidatus Melainabacteria bacterium]